MEAIGIDLELEIIIQPLHDAQRNGSVDMLDPLYVCAPVTG